ncbi:Hypoxic response protein 1 [bacterium HR36]|uniref:Signal transduction protein n=1 Tax=uncultured Planctomycetota bacterium TaxID=120965 RepID=H5SCC6_9BACT|nr:signal transduction protein [uncultured Planctomycetota bacterium]GBD36015.1 Hypoxic response protein 1 [bacterium HR36]
MARLRELLQLKGGQVLTISPSQTVLAAAELMNQHHIGCLVVCDERGICGILSERDILQRVVAARRDPSSTTVGEVMTTQVIFAAPDMPIDQAQRIMMEKRIRHLPVIGEDGQLCGMISIGDLNAWEARTKDTTIHLLQEYIYGRPAPSGSS